MTEEMLAVVPQGTDEAAWLSACAAVRAYCGWHIAPAVTETLTLDGPGGTLLCLPSALVTSVASVTNDGTALDDPEWSAHGMIRAHCWTEKFRGVVVELTHGYSECPPEILTVLTDMAAATGRGGVSSVTSGSHQVSFEPASPDSRQRSVLDHYRLAPLP